MKVIRSLGNRKKSLMALGAVIVASTVFSVWLGGAVKNAPATHDGTGESLAAAGPSTGGMALKVIGSVAVVIGILYVGTYVMKRLYRGPGSGGIREDAISVLGRRHIAPKKAIFVVKVGKRAMVVGVTDAQISHLTDLSEDELQDIKVSADTKSGQFKKHLLAFGLGIKDRG